MEIKRTIFKHPSQTTGLIKTYKELCSGYVDNINIYKHAYNTSGNSTKAFYSHLLKTEKMKYCLGNHLNKHSIYGHTVQHFRTELVLNGSKIISISGNGGHNSKTNLR